MTVEPMTDVDRIRAQWVDDLRRAVTVSKHDKHMQVSPLQVACLFKALDAERTRADAARAEGVREGIEMAARCVEGGRFLHDDAPPARWAREAAPAIRRLSPPPAEPTGGTAEPSAPVAEGE